MCGQEKFQEGLRGSPKKEKNEEPETLQELQLMRFAAQELRKKATAIANSGSQGLLRPPIQKNTSHGMIQPGGLVPDCV